MGKQSERSRRRGKRKSDVASVPDPRAAMLRRVALVALLLPVVLLVVQVHYLVPDSAGYLSFARSLLWDRDVDFHNEYARFGMIEREPGIEFGAVTASGRPGNPFGVGCALMWLPFVIATELLALLASLAGVGVATDGFGTATLWAAHIGTWTYAIGTGVVAALILGRLFPALDTRARCAALVAVLAGTPVIYYVLQMPSYSHVCSAFAVTLLVWLSLRWQHEWTLVRALLIGASLGLAGLVRNQELAFGVVPLVLAWSGGALRRKPVMAAPFAAAAAVVFVPQLAVWAAVYGSPWHLPQGGGFLQLSADRFWKVMFDTRHGLFAWSPIVLVAVAGWVVLLRDGKTRALGLAVVLAFALQWFVNSLPVDWWAGWSFGARRFTNCTALFVIGYGAILVARPRVSILLYVLVAMNIVQWLRVGTMSLSGETAPGWNTLWGTAFIGFLPKVPLALWQLLAVPWTYMQVLRRPSAIPPSFHDDASAFIVAVLVLWALGIIWSWHRWTSRSSGPGASARRVA